MVQKTDYVTKRDIQALIKRANQSKIKVEVLEWKRPFRILKTENGKKTFERFQYYYEIKDWLMSLPIWD